MLNRTFSLLFLLTLGLVLWSGSLGIRRAIFSQQTRSLEGEEAPFILEAALQYRMTRMVYEDGRLPSHEPKVQYPEGVNPWRTYSIGAEYLYAGVAHLLPEEMSLVSRFRWASVGIFALAIPLFALWCGLMWDSKMGGVTAGLILMISPAFAVRSSGLALSRENLAFPFLALFLVAEVLARRSGDGRGRWGWALTAGVAAGLAQMSWDLSQYMLTLWIVWRWIEHLCGKPTEETERGLLLCVGGGLTLAGLAHPYLRAQGFLFSPCMVLMYTRLLVELPMVRGWRPLHARLAAGVLGVGWFTAGRVFLENYGHFGELVIAKLRFMNEKPADPELLSYAQRIMWTPALNSATWDLTKAYFPFTLWVMLVAGVFLWWRRRQNSAPVGSVLFYAVATLPMYLFFFRLHVFLIVFAAALIGGLTAMGFRNSRGWVRWGVVPVLILLLTGMEFHRLLFFEPTTDTPEDPERARLMAALEEMGMVSRRRGNRWGHPGQSYDQLQGLVGMLNQLPESDTGEPSAVLANFGVSGTILAGSGMPILLHPKFETPGIRERVREFYEHLFLEDEKSLRDWALDHGARYYVHSNGSLSEQNLRESPRYMVNALEPPEHAAVHVMETRPREAVWMQPVHENARYRIFRLISQEEEEMAGEFTEMAENALRRGDRQTANQFAWRAFEYHWRYPPARELIERIGLPRPAGERD